MKIDYYKLFNHFTNQFKKGYLNELLICGNLEKLGLKCYVLHNNNPNYDIVFTYKDKTYYLECKLDVKSLYSPNFYFEVWNYTYNVPTGIINKDMDSLFSYTFLRDNNIYCLFGKRRLYKEAI
jgi:hypothetical protein